MQISASIVLYHNSTIQLSKAIHSFLDTNLEVKLYLIDNSGNDHLKDLQNIDNRVEYYFNNANLGYGSAHNIALNKSINLKSEYHLILNPDVYFKKGVLEQIYTHMSVNANIGNIMPKVLFPDGEMQYLCKLLPSPIHLFLRRFLPKIKFFEKLDAFYELQFSGYKTEMNVPYLSGCFMFIRTESLISVGLFDENFFMYLEDTDLNRRIHAKYKTVFYPDVSVIHEYEKGSYKQLKLLLYHIRSAIYYFNKWGWFFDRERNDINSQCLSSIKKNELLDG